MDSIVEAVFQHAQQQPARPAIIFDDQAISYRQLASEVGRFAQSLASWGLHRMGPGGPKLVEFRVMTESFRELEERIASLSAYTLSGIESDQVPTVSEGIWDVIAALRIGDGETKIVSGSKALHHVLPELVPPIDHEYTLRFFFNHKNLYQGDRAAFETMFPYFRLVATSCHDGIAQRTGRGMNTSSTKVIDNAVVGFVRTRLGAAPLD